MVFVVGKLFFCLACHGTEQLSVTDVVAILHHGHAMDHSTAAYLLLPTWLCLLIGCLWHHRVFQLVPKVWHVVAAVLVIAFIVVDAALYPFWGFKLDATIFNYIDKPADALASVSLGFVLVRVLAVVVVATFVAWLLLKVPLPQPGRWHALPLLLVGGVLFVMLRGGVTESTMNVGNAYFSNRQFLNHAAVNPVFSLLSSSSKSDRFGELYNQLSDEEMEEVLKELPRLSPIDPSPNPSLVGRGSILLIVWEGCGGQLTEAIGGRKDVTPHLDSLIREGLSFSQLRANSFRTDRGLLSILSGHISYPTHSLMKMATKAARLPSIARTLRKAGYENTFIYGGDVNFTNMKGYLMATGYDRIIADTDFSRAERATAKWGVNDSILFERLWMEMASSAQSAQFITALTLSSHEPWDVPSQYRRQTDPDEKVAAFRYTDAQLGRFMTRLKALPLWDNTLVIILPDHGVLAGDVTEWQDPRFFHIPMVWTGGAVGTIPPQSGNSATEGNNSQFSLPCSQSDLAATLLGVLGLPHDDFPWSRDVFSPSYARYPFTYSTFVDGFAFTDSTGTTIFDNISGRTIVNTHVEGEAVRKKRGQAIQQKSYDLLEKL